MQKQIVINKETIKNIAFRVEAHPLHIKFFMSNFADISKKDIEVAYKEYVNENPKPFVKWVGGKNFIKTYLIMKSNKQIKTS